VEGEVNDNYRGQVHRGEVVAVTVPAENWRQDLALTEIFPISQSASRTFKIRTAVVHNSNLVPGMFARLQLPLPSSPGILIPMAAVRQVGQLTMVQVLVNGQAQLRQVRLGRQVNQDIEVLAGLQPGDKIFVSADYDLK
jgi:multidrug efflux pump subunit AcrA (membrane-fusion protein)